MPKMKAESKEYVIYLIVSPIDFKKIYINKTYPHRLRKTYTEHIKLRVTKTKDMCTEAEGQHSLPPLYILETALMSPSEAFRHCVAWTRYFIDFGYTQITEDILTKYATDLTPETEAYYNLIKSKPIVDILLPEGGIYPDYGTNKKTRNQTDKHTISIRFEPEEYLLIRKKAHISGVSMGEYCRNRILKSEVVHLDYILLDTLWHNHDTELELLKLILYAVYTTQRYYPADINNLQHCANCHRELLDQTISELEKIIKEVQTPKETVNKQELSELIANRGESDIVVSCTVSKSEYDIIKQKAEQHHMSVSLLCHSIAKHGRLITTNLDFASKQEKCSLSITCLLQQIMYTIYITGNYYPPDLALIQEEIDSLENKQCQCYEAISNHLHQLSIERF